MIRNVAHLCLNVTDLDASLGFYRDVLGLPVAFEFHRDDGRRYGLYLHVGGRTFIELFEGQHDPDDQKRSYRHFCLEVDDVPQFVSQLRTHGIQASEPKLGKDQSWQAWVEDPDGNRIELHQYTPQSWQTPSLTNWTTG